MRRGAHLLQHPSPPGRLGALASEDRCENNDQDDHQKIPLHLVLRLKNIPLWLVSKLEYLYIPNQFARYAVQKSN